MGCSGPRLAGQTERSFETSPLVPDTVLVLPLLFPGSGQPVTPATASLPDGLVQQSDITYRADRFPGRADIKELLEALLVTEGIPKEFGALVWIESDFSVGCYSHVGAAGPWQMMRETGREMGLRIDDIVDERYSWVASTRAAARYLSAMYAMFGDWSLAIAAYNCGAGRVLSGMPSSDCTFGEVDLPGETDAFVPRFASAASAYAEVELETEGLAIVWVPAGLDLRILAAETGMNVDSLMDINRSYLLEKTPPEGEAWEIIVPSPRAVNVLETAWSMNPERYSVRSGDSWAVLASRFGITTDALIQFNSGVSLQPGILIGLPESQRRPVNAGYVDNPQFFAYTVRMGDTMGGIGASVGVSSREVATWNDISSGDTIYPGQVLMLRRTGTAPDISDAESEDLPAESEIDIVTGGGRLEHTVAEGDTLWDLAIRYGISIEQIMFLNSLEGNTLSIGDVLLIRPE